MAKAKRKSKNTNRKVGRKKASEKHQEAMEFARRSFREYADAYKALAKS